MSLDGVMGTTESAGAPASVPEQGQAVTQPQQMSSSENMGGVGEPTAGNTANATNATNVTNAPSTPKDNAGPVAGFTAEAYRFAMPEAVAQDSALVSRIQDFCVNSQLSPQQAQAVLGFWQNEQNAVMEQGLKQCEQSLKDRWQGGYEQRLEQARSTLKMLDAHMEGRLMPLMQGPLGNSPVFVEMLDKLADVVGETTMEAGGMGGTRGSYAGSQLMSTEDFLRQVVFK